MPHATQTPAIAATASACPQLKVLPDAEVCPELGRANRPHTVSFLRLHNSQLQLFFLVLFGFLFLFLSGAAFLSLSVFSLFGGYDA